MEIKNDYEKLFIKGNAPIEGLVEITVTSIINNQAGIKVDMVDNDGNVLIRTAPRFLGEGDTFTIDKVKISVDVSIEKPVIG